MGTRHVTMVISKKKIKVAQYGQWDGYIEGQGLTIAKFISKLNKYKKHSEFKSAIDNLKEVTQDELKQMWVDCGANPDSEYVTMDVSAKFENNYPEFHRNTGAEILDLILKGVTRVQLDVDAAISNESWVEYVYVLNLDKKELEIYTGHKTKGNLYKTLKFSKVSADSIRKLANEYNKEQE